MDRSALRSVGSGVGAAVVAYALTGLVALSLLPRLITQATPTGEESGLFQAYEAAGQPLWRAAGWILFNENFIPISVSSEGETTYGILVPTLAGAEWLFVIPALACLLGGLVAVRLTTTSSTIPVAVGAYLTVGYTLITLVAALLFTMTAAGYTVQPNLLSGSTLIWPLVIVGYPLIFGSLGAVIATSPLVREVASSRPESER
ncbi:hypothetical protein [Candidatus Halobonum tyrrellensis]|uniref:hypothetical protein n=1 Tax=Candidatus Halobonum tyrrellensis TaxID=1431545 RepID=UPI0012683E01|nr:hypothetical protein [Candidatus Halobonum tyrrellensis]